MVFVILQITNNVKLKAMKNVLLILTLCVGMVACSGGKTKSTDENSETKRNLVELTTTDAFDNKYHFSFNYDNACDYRFELNDYYKDGWDGAI